MFNESTGIFIVNGLPITEQVGFGMVFGSSPFIPTVIVMSLGKAPAGITTLIESDVSNVELYLL